MSRKTMDTVTEQKKIIIIKEKKSREKLWTLSLNFCPGEYSKEVSQKGNTRVRVKMFFQEILKHNFLIEINHD